VLELADREAGPVGLDDERADPARMAGVGVGDGEDHVEVRDAEVRDPVLGAVDDPRVAVAHRARAHAARVRAGVGLGEREGRGPLAAGALGQEPLLELVAAEEPDRQRPELLDHEHERARGARLCDLLDRDVQHQRAGSGAAVLGLERQAEEVVLREQLAQVLRVFAFVVDLGRARRHPLGHDLADRVAEVDVLLRERVEIGGRLGRGHGRRMISRQWG
jgi:hypothetical protein